MSNRHIDALNQRRRAEREKEINDSRPRIMKDFWERFGIYVVLAICALVAYWAFGDQLKFDFDIGGYVSRKLQER